MGPRSHHSADVECRTAAPAQGETLGPLVDSAPLSPAHTFGPASQSEPGPGQSDRGFRSVEPVPSTDVLVS